MTSLPPVPAVPSAVMTRLAHTLRRAQYTPTALRGIWGVDADAALEANDPAPARRACARILAGHSATRETGEGTTGSEATSDGSASDPRPLAALASVLLLDQPVPHAHLTAALGDELVTDLTEAGMLRTGAPTARGTARPEAWLSSVLALTCHALPVGVPRHQRPGDETLLLVSDHGTLTTPDPLDGGYVLGLGGAGRTLAEITPRGPVEVAADVGTGCGVQAVLLARHAERVIATDISGRALAVAALTAELNGVRDVIEFRSGSLYGPLPEAVDLLVSNPPFVITPRKDAEAAGTAPHGAAGSGEVFEYRDGGRTGDAIMREVIGGAPARLCTDGQAVFLGNWEYGPGRVRPHEWLSGTTTSAAVVERQRMSPAEYARTWIRDGGVPRAGERWQAEMTAWLDDFEEREVEYVGFGWVLLHRGQEGGPDADVLGASDAVSPDAPEAEWAPLRSFARIDTGPGSNPAGLAAFLDTRLGLLEWLEAAADDELASTCFMLAGDVTEHRHLRPGAEDPTMITIEQGAGLARTFQADPALAGFLGVCDGSLTLGRTAAALAQLLDADAEKLTRQLTRQVRALVPEGVLVPAPA